MQLKLLLGILLTAIVYALITKPFQNGKRVKEFANHILIAFLCYYGTYAIFFFFGFPQDTSMAIGAIFTIIALVFINMFFRKPES